jgi:hypothetical protein
MSTDTTNHDVLVWGPNPPGGRNSRGEVLPAGWVWSCSCGERGVGMSSEDAADDGGTVHEIEAVSGV